MDVLRNVITEDEAYNLPMDLFKTLAACSSDIVIKRIDEYLESSEGTEVVKRRVREAFSEVQRRRDYISSEQVTATVAEIAEVTYADISASQPLDKLISWRNAIAGILNSDFAVAYIAPVRSDTLMELLTQMGNSQNVAAIDVAGKIEDNYRNLFKDAPFKGYKGTPMKRIITNRTQYELYLRGLDFIIEKKRSGENLQKWRFM